MWTVQAAAGTQAYVQTFSSVSAARDVERLTNDQRTPTPFVNLSAQWVRLVCRHALMAIENLFGTRADVARSPVLTLGYPRSVRAGVRLFLP